MPRRTRPEGNARGRAPADGRPPRNRSPAPNVLELDPRAFNDYLRHDGLAHLLIGRLDRGELDQPAAERYSKYAKAAFAVGDAAAGGRPPV